MGWGRKVAGVREEERGGEEGKGRQESGRRRDEEGMDDGQD